MADQTERTPRRGMTFPFLLTLLIFAAVVADLWLTEPGFIASAGWRRHPWIFAGIIILGFLLWLWVLAAARRRTTRFEGPIEATRGSNGALQPILATVFLVIGLNLLWSHTLPKWLNGIVAEQVTSESFMLAGDIAAPRAGCSRAPASHPRYGEVRLCLPQSAADMLRENAGGEVTVTGPSSWFGIEPQRYTLATAEPIVPAELTIAPAADSAEVPAGSDTATSIDDLFDKVFGGGEDTPSGKTGRR